MSDMLAKWRTADEMRAGLMTGLTASELDHVGFDQVTIADCIERVVQAALHDRSNAGSQEVRKRLTLSMDLYFAAMREAAVRRFAGAASCMPHVR